MKIIVTATAACCLITLIIENEHLTDKITMSLMLLYTPLSATVLLNGTFVSITQPHSVEKKGKLYLLCERGRLGLLVMTFPPYILKMHTFPLKISRF